MPYLLTSETPMADDHFQQRQHCAAHHPKDHSGCPISAVVVHHRHGNGSACCAPAVMRYDEMLAQVSSDFTR